MKIIEFITIYWSQVTLILFGIGFLIKSIVNDILSKRNINHNLFQQNKIDSLSRFFNVYSKTEQMWTGIAIYDILNHKLSAQELDNIVFPLMNELQASVMELQIYFEENEYKDFKAIEQNMFFINQKLSEVYFDDNSKRNIIKSSNEFQFFRHDKLNENEIIFKKVSRMIKKTFK